MRITTAAKSRLPETPLARRGASVRPSLLIPLLVCLILAATACLTVNSPRPRASYQADVTVYLTEPDGEERIVDRFVELYSRHGKRTQLSWFSGKLKRVIDRPDLGVSWILDPVSHTYQEIPVDVMSGELTEIPNPFSRRVSSRFHFKKREWVQGRPTRREYEVKGEIARGIAWMGTGTVPLRFEGEIGPRGSALRVRFEYDAIVRDRIEARHFEIPSTYAGYADRAGANLRALVAAEQWVPAAEQLRAIRPQESSARDEP